MKYVKPNGTIVDINENSEAKAKELGWKKHKEVKKAAKKEAE